VESLKSEGPKLIYFYNHNKDCMKLKKWVLLMVIVFQMLAVNPSLDRHIIPVYGNASLGYYYVNLFIGSPPQ
jgi:hypothetical protein